MLAARDPGTANCPAAETVAVRGGRDTGLNAGNGPLRQAASLAAWLFRRVAGVPPALRVSSCRRDGSRLVSQVPGVQAADGGGQLAGLGPMGGQAQPQPAAKRHSRSRLNSQRRAEPARTVELREFQP